MHEQSLVCKVMQFVLFDLVNHLINQHISHMFLCCVYIIVVMKKKRFYY